MLTANVSKIRKNLQPNIPFILNVLSENEMTFVQMGSLFKIKK